MGWGPWVYMIWCAVMLASLAVAALHVWRRRSRGVGPALTAVVGALLSWWLVSAYIGACEIDRYAASAAFPASLIVGLAGLALVARSCMGLRKHRGSAADAP